MNPTVRFVLGCALAVLVIAIAGMAAFVYPFLQALHITPAEVWEAIWR